VVRSAILFACLGQNSDLSLLYFSITSTAGLDPESTSGATDIATNAYTR
jgi:hypothetical protein